MKIYRISQDDNNGYDTYDSAIVIAKNEEEAKRIHPDDIWEKGGYYDEDKKEFWSVNRRNEKYKFEEKHYGTWTNDLTKIKVEYIGEAKEELNERIILSSFNAG